MTQRVSLVPATAQPNKIRYTPMNTNLPNLLVATLMLAACSPLAHAQTPSAGEGPGPWDQDVALWRVGAEDSGALLHTFHRAGVPSLARLNDGRLIAAFQHFPENNARQFDRVAVSFSSDSGITWTDPQPIEIAGMEAGLSRSFDPTLLPLPDGRVRLYFTSNSSPDFRRSTPRIYSAISADGVNYQFEPGVRFSVDDHIVIDCAVALHEGVFHLFAPDNGTVEEFGRAMQGGGAPPSDRGFHATSVDGLSFQRQPDITGKGQNKFLGCAVSFGEWLLFFGSGPGPWPLRSGDGQSWQEPRVSMRIPGADPGAVALADGTWLILSTTPPRDGTPSAQKSGRQPQQQPQPQQEPPQQRPSGGRSRIDQGSLQVGQPAPDFTLSGIDGKDAVALSELQGKPTVLVFGSCSCPPFVRSTAAVNALHERYRDRVSFVMVYIKEAHPTDGRVVPGNQFEVKSPTTLAERCALARDFDQRIGINLPLVVDTIDDATSRLYSPWPNRMVIIDAHGHIADIGEAGPQGTAQSAARAPEVLERLLHN